MPAEATGEQQIQLLLSAFFLAPEGVDESMLRRASMDWIAEWLGLGPREHFGTYALRHLVAVQLAPRAAISYEPTNPTPRWRLVDDYLREMADLDIVERNRVARLVATVLDRASTGRGRRLLEPDWAAACGLCRLSFRSNPDSVRTRDPYKPVWQAPEELCRPEVDHVVPISGIGQHEFHNLQVICRACNMAKGSGLIVDPDAEIRYAGVEVASIPRIHLFRLLQWLIQQRRGACARCKDATSELTMRPTHSDGSISRANLELRCYGCV